MAREQGTTTTTHTRTDREQTIIKARIPVLILTGIVIILLSGVFPVTAQDNFCPSNVISDISSYYYSCKNSNDAAACRQYYEASYCAAKCYPACYVQAPSGYDYSGVTCPCEGSGGFGGGTGGGGDDIPWVVIIGGLAAAGIAAVAISKGLGKKKTGEKKEKKGPVRYILQITPADKIKVGPNEPGSFTATAWKVDEKGVASQAGNAAISIAPPAGLPGLSVAPASGMGSVTATVSLDRPSGVDTAQIKVTASVGGKGISANITVTFEAETRIEFD